MAGDTEAARKLGVEGEIASLQLKDLATAVAAEVMVMSLAGDLVTECFAGHGDGRKPVTLQQRTDVAIYGSDTQTLDLGLRCGENFFRGKRPVSPEKSLPDRRFLTCVSRLYGQVASPKCKGTLLI